MRSEEGDIRGSGKYPGEGGGPCGDLIWLVDGDELPFEDVSADFRPWLEESSDWASEETPPESPAGPPASDNLVWL